MRRRLQEHIPDDPMVAKAGVAASRSGAWIGRDAGAQSAPTAGSEASVPLSGRGKFAGDAAAATRISASCRRSRKFPVVTMTSGGGPIAAMRHSVGWKS